MKMVDQHQHQVYLIIESELNKSKNKYYNSM